MSEPIPESIPTSADPRSQRPTKRRALTPRAALAHDVEALFAKPDKAMSIASLTPTSLSAPPELVANVQGSSAGAGSGEFHVYKASRRREYERLRAMDDEVQREAAATDFLARRAAQEKRDAEKTERNRAKRAKALARKKGKKGGDGKEGAEDGVQTTKRKLVPNATSVFGAADGHDEQDPDTALVPNADELGLVIQDDD
ncbi:DUF1168-domain-containing protein [Didymella exigua CBS 183.55]|uniref:DUF1168-domain-containing protein n=1 Tax=Didymella exigua CBS 183.55 TaxID=1150837 RepID=A0A6A5RS92_9PLEO|nr:DUF1168-domain-containing protein [Didymella exigua CBS 183.55]KAF1931255.1 DUF1168-domain-containing protein [Didymella exigua CBS 183.55]